MSLPSIHSSRDFSIDPEDDANVTKKLSMLGHVKKKAANDAQLLMNRIALIQKEEERARKKIQETKERAAEIIALRNENERRVQAYVNAASEVRQLQQVLIAKNREQDTEGKKARQQRLEMLKHRRKEEVAEMLMEKKYLSQMMIQEQSKEIQTKQIKREQVKRMEEEMRAKKEAEKREKERKMKEEYAKKLEAEALEARRAEKLVKMLEKKEKEWIAKLRATQTVQDTAFEQLESALNTVVPRPHGGRISQGSEMSDLDNSGFNSSHTSDRRKGGTKGGRSKGAVGARSSSPNELPPMSGGYMREDSP